MSKKKKDNEEETTEIIPPRGFDLIFKDAEAGDDETTSIQEKTLEKALDELFSTQGIDLKSDISNIQISAITRGYIFADVYKCKYMSELVRHILELSVSKNRQGRGEFVKVLQSANNQQEEPPLKLMRRRLLE